jgi:hypothetical protein
MATHAAEAAVSEGGAVARSAAGGVAAARALVLADEHRLAGGLLVSPQISVRASPGPKLIVSIEAGVPSLLPGLHLSVRATSEGPTQQFRGDG